MASPVRIGRTVRAATVTVILAAFAVLPGCLLDSGEPNPLLFTGPSEPVPLWGPLPKFSFTPQNPSAGDTVSFDASRTAIGPGHTIASYSWLFGDGGTGTGVTASRTYASDGSYAVTLTVADNLGAAVSRRQAVVVGTLTPPTALFVFSKVGAAVPVTVNFDGTTSTTEPGRTITNYAWVFGNGQTASGASATTSTVYATAGSFNATLTVTDSAGLTGSVANTVSIP